MPKWLSSSKSATVGKHACPCICVADALALAGLDYLVVGPKVLAALAESPTLQARPSVEASLPPFTLHALGAPLSGRGVGKRKVGVDSCARGPLHLYVRPSQSAQGLGRRCPCGQERLG